MSRSVFLISKDPTFIFMMTTIIDNLGIPLQSVDRAESLWKEIDEEEPGIVIWDVDGATKIEQIENTFHRELPESSHLFVFSNTIAGLSHLKNGRLHLFERSFSPSEISHLIKELIS